MPSVTDNTPRLTPGGAGRFVWTTLQGVVRIASADVPVDRTGLLRAYLSVSAKELLLHRLLGLRPQRQRLLGYSVRCTNFTALWLLIREIFVENCYAFEASRGDPLVFDCGSNIGLSVLYFKHRYPAARVVAFEPSPHTFRILEENLRRNAVCGVRAVNKALGREPGLASFYFSADDLAEPSQGLVRNPRIRGLADCVEVPVVRLSESIDEPVDFLKIDVEGSEEGVLEDLVESGKMALVHGLALEYHHHLPPGTDKLSRVLRLLEEAGFTYTVSAPYRPTLPPDSGEDVFIRAYRCVAS